MSGTKTNGKVVRESAAHGTRLYAIRVERGRVFWFCPFCNLPISVRACGCGIAAWELDEEDAPFRQMPPQEPRGWVYLAWQWLEKLLAWLLDQVRLLLAPPGRARWRESGKPKIAGAVDGDVFKMLLETRMAFIERYGAQEGQRRYIMVADRLWECPTREAALDVLRQHVDIKIEL